MIRMILLAGPVHGCVRILVYFTIGSDKLYFTSVLKKKNGRQPGRLESFRFRRFAAKENNAKSAPPPKRPVAPNWAPGSAGLETDWDRLG